MKVLIKDEKGDVKKISHRQLEFTRNTYRPSRTESYQGRDISAVVDRNKHQYFVALPFMELFNRISDGITHRRDVDLTPVSGPVALEQWKRSHIKPG